MSTEEKTNRLSMWSPSGVAALRGRKVLVGMTFVSPDKGAPPRFEQVHGRVMDLVEGKGVKLALEGTRAGEELWLPPELDSFNSAAPGAYRLKTTGEEVLNPDYLATWTIHEKAGS